MSDFKCLLLISVAPPHITPPNWIYDTGSTYIFQSIRWHISKNTLFIYPALNVTFFLAFQENLGSTVSSRLDNGPLAWFRALVVTDLLLVLFFGREDGLWKCTIVKNRVSYISTKRRVKSLNESTDSIYHFCWIVNITSLKFHQQLNSRLHNLFEGNKTSLQREVMLLEKGVLLLQENLYMYCAFYLPKANLFCSRWRVSPY